MRIEPTVHLIKLISIIFFSNFNYFTKLDHMKCAPINDEISYEYSHTHKKEIIRVSISRLVEESLSTGRRGSANVAESPPVLEN